VTALDAGGEVVIAGELGELHPRVVEARDLHVERLVVAELSIRGLSGAALPVVRSVPPSRYPDVDRDLAVVVAETVASADVEDAIRSGAGGLLRDLRLFDVYRGAPLAVGERSLAFRLTFGSSARTLTEDEVEAAVAATIGALERQIGARIRG
jgi:phenylalanyl-tRNA synthetase beta chain